MHSPGHSYQIASNATSPNKDNFVSSFLNFCNRLDKDYTVPHPMPLLKRVIKKKDVINKEFLIDKNNGSCENICDTHFNVMYHDINKTMDHNSTCNNIYKTSFNMVKQETDLSNKSIDKSGPMDKVIKVEIDIPNEAIDNACSSSNHVYNTHLIKQEVDMSNQTIDKPYFELFKQVTDTSNKSIDNRDTCDNIRVKQETDMSNNVINNAPCDIKQELDIDNSDCNNVYDTNFEIVKLEPYDGTIDKSDAPCDKVVKLEFNPNNAIDNTFGNDSNMNREELIIPDICNNLETSRQETDNFVWDPDDEETRSNDGTEIYVDYSIPETQPGSSTLILKDLLSQKQKVLCSDDDEDTKSDGETQTHNGQKSQPVSSSEFLKESKRRKRTKRISLTAVEKQQIIDYHKHIQETWPTSEYPYKTTMVKKTAAFFDITSGSVYRILKEYETFGTVKAPITQKKRLKFSDKLNESQKMAILNIVDSFGESPSFRDIFKAVNDDSQLPNFKRTTFQKILKRLRTCGVDWSDNS